MYQMNFISIQFKFKLIDSRDKDYGPPARPDLLRWAIIGGESIDQR